MNNNNNDKDKPGLLSHCVMFYIFGILVALGHFTAIWLLGAK